MPWLVKSEPEVYSIDDFSRDKKTLWDCVRNYQARNFLKTMKVGEQVLFYHSNANPAAIVGLASVTKTAAPDPTQFDKKSEYYDPKSSLDNPLWFSPQLKFIKKFAYPLDLARLRQQVALKNMQLLKRGSRLSVQSVTEQEFEKILALAEI